jgi:hypothetical protein
MRQSRKNIVVGGTLVLGALLASCEGPTGPAGTTGTAGLSGLQTTSTETTIASNAIATLRPECPADKKVISGGYSAGGDGSQFVTAYQSYPDASNAWVVAVRNGYTGPLKVSAFALCASVS